MCIITEAYRFNRHFADLCKVLSGVARGREAARSLKRQRRLLSNANIALSYGSIKTAKGYLYAWKLERQRWAHLTNQVVI